MLDRLVRRLRGLHRLPGFHSMILRQEPKDFELATQIASVVAYRKFVGPITLFADVAGARWARRTGIIGLYDDVRPLAVDPRVDLTRFWAAGKIAAMAEMRAPCCSVDTDAILMTRPAALPAAVALHAEPEDWEVYRSSAFRRTLDVSVGLKGACTFPPANTAVLAFNDEDLRAEYCELARWHMVQESRRPTLSSGYEVHIEGQPVRAMVLVEQYLLSALCSARGKRLRFLGDLDPATNHLSRNPEVLHLWSSKRFYAKHARAHERFLDSVMDLIKGLGDTAAHDVCRANGLPVCRVTDANTGVRRWSYAGEWVGPGETSELL